MYLKIKAFGLHLFISFFIAILAASLVFIFWYPNNLHKAVGVTDIFILLLVIDMILGPLLTLIVYKKGKRTLIMDLTVIAVLQLSALGYGLWTVAEGRPAWLVFGGQHFELVRKVDVKPHQLVRQPSWFGPEWVSVQQPLQLGLTSLFGNNRNTEQSLYRQPAQYQRLDAQASRLQKAALPMTMLERNNSTEAIAASLKKWPQADAWLPLRANNQDMVVLMHKETAEVVAIVDLHPWH